MAHNGMRDGRRRQTARRVALAATVAGALAVIVPAAAWATTIQDTSTQTSYGPQKTDWGTSGGTPASVLLSFNGFNSAFGPLQSVQLTVTETLQGTATGTNTTGQNGTTGNTESTTFQITNDGVVVNSGTSGPAINISANNVQSVYSGPIAPQATVGPLTIAGSTSTSQTFTSNLGFFESAYTLTASDTASEGLTGGGANIDASFTDLGQVSVTALYTYGTSVPEPGSLLLLGTGLMGLGMVMSRRRRMF